MTDRWSNSEAGQLQRFVRRSAAWKPMTALYARTLHHIDALVYRRSEGKSTFTSWLTGLPIVMLTTTGAKSGQRRTLPLVGIPDGDAIVVIASSYGRTHNPAWYHNLKAHPRASIRWDGREIEVVAQELEGEERRRFYERGIEIYPGWVEYEKRAPRKIPVLRLVPAEQ